MHFALKERVNTNWIKFACISAILLSLCISKTFAQENQQAFDYTKTVWIINVMEGSGTVYGRPRPEDYNPRQGFIRIYEILIKYVYNMQDLNSAIPPSSLTVTHELILINGAAEQRILIGDHWISDEKNIALISEVDYSNLKEWLGTLEKNQDYKNNPPIDKLVKAFRDGTYSEIESFDKYFNSKQTSASSVKTQETTAKPPELFDKNIHAEPAPKSGQSTNQDKTKVTVKFQDSIDTTKIKSRLDANAFSMSSTRSSSSAIKVQTKAEAPKFSMFFYLAVFIIPLCLLFSRQYWKNRKR